MQITTLIIGPVFFTAALYVLLGTFIAILGRGYSLISARMYTIVFLSCDLISLVLQVSNIITPFNITLLDPTFTL